MQLDPIAPNRSGIRSRILFSGRTGTSVSEPLKDKWGEFANLQYGLVTRLELEVTCSVTVLAAAATPFKWYDWPRLIDSVILEAYNGHRFYNAIPGEIFLYDYLQQVQGCATPWENIDDTSTDFLARTQIADDAAAHSLKFRIPLIAADVDPSVSPLQRARDEEIPWQAFGSSSRIAVTYRTSLGANVSAASFSTTLVAHVRESRAPFLPAWWTVEATNLGASDKANYAFSGLIRHGSICRAEALNAFPDVARTASDLARNLYATYTGFDIPLLGYTLAENFETYARRAFQLGSMQLPEGATYGIPNLWRSGYVLALIPCIRPNRASEAPFIGSTTFDVQFRTGTRTATDQLSMRLWHPRPRELGEKLTGKYGADYDNYLHRAGVYKGSKVPITSTPIPDYLPVSFTFLED